MAYRPPRLYRFAHWLVPLVVRRWVRLECHGVEHIPRQGPVIVAANHLSYFDPLCLGVAVDGTGRMVRFLAKIELFRVPVLGFLLRGIGQIPVHRESRDAAKAFAHAVTAVRDGGAVAIYPEGTTTTNPDFSPMKPKNGVARLAALTGAPVVPVGMWGAHLLFAQGKLGPFRPGIRVVLRAGPPMELGLSPDAPLEAVNAARDRVMDAIIDLVDEAKQGWEPPRWYRRPVTRAP